VERRELLAIWDMEKLRDNRPIFWNFKEKYGGCSCSGNCKIFKVAIFMLEKRSVYCAVRAGSLYII
jgi:hypothetical protein